jgi:hypothetical protein
VLKVESVNHRDTRWGVPFPTYRVHFWDQPIADPVGCTLYAYEVTGAHNVHQVFAWAEANARGRTYEVFVVYSDGEHGVGEFQLSGSDPTHPGDPRAEPPADLQAEDELEAAEQLAKSRAKASERVWGWLRRDEAERPSN